MKFVYIETYPPYECGTCTFTNNLFKSILNRNENQNEENEGFVVALNNNELEYKYPEEVKATIGQYYQEDYLKALEYINLVGPAFVFSSMNLAFSELSSALIPKMLGTVHLNSEA
jgi:hypothetical protein